MMSHKTNELLEEARSASLLNEGIVLVVTALLGFLLFTEKGGSVARFLLGAALVLALTSHLARVFMHRFGGDLTRREHKIQIKEKTSKEEPLAEEADSLELINQPSEMHAESSSLIRRKNMARESMFWGATTASISLVFGLIFLLL